MNSYVRTYCDYQSSSNSQIPFQPSLWCPLAWAHTAGRLLMSILSPVQIPTHFANPSMSRIFILKLNQTTPEGTSCDPTALHGYLVSLYYRSRFTVPVLWDKKLQTIVNNESSEIIRMFNASFNEFIPAEKAALDFYPQESRAEIDAVNEWIYPNINSMSSVFPGSWQRFHDAFQMACIDRASPQHKLHTKKRWLNFLTPLTRSRSSSLEKTSLSETGSRKQT